MCEVLCLMALCTCSYWSGRGEAWAVIADMVMATLIYRLHSGAESVTKEDHLASYYLDNQQGQADRLLCNGICLDI